MGDPKKQRKKFSKPTHPWQKDRIEAERKIMKDYGLRRKNEIWKMDSLLRKFLNRAKTLIAQRTKQSDVETKQLMDRLQSMGLLKKESRVDEILSLTLKDVMDRRLQALVCKLHLANGMMQARQFIVHEHVSVAGKKITSPSYLVSVEEESKIALVRAFDIQKPGSAKQESAKEVKE